MADFQSDDEHISDELQPPTRMGFTYDRGDNCGRENDLTEQEELILTLLTMGFDNSEIAGQLHISPNTLKTHFSHIYRKLGVSDRTQAVVWAFRNGLFAGKTLEEQLPQ
jgi:DNA-binding NarL/FixJ family response regulator